MAPRPRYPGSAATPAAPNEAHQHDLSAQAAGLVAQQAGLAQGARVLEIGPGLGALTAALLATGARVLAIERDPERVQHLRQRFADQIALKQFTLMTGDAMRVIPTFNGAWSVVANPPFSLTAPLVRHWLLQEQPPQAMTLVLQREAAEKLTGVNLGHTRSSILSHLTGVPAVALTLPRQAVTPPSRVDLAVWHHRRHVRAPNASALQSVDRLLSIAFAGPRTMQEALRSLATSIQLRRQASMHGWSIEDHPRTLSPAAWLDFAQLLATCNKLPTSATERRQQR
jgi:16S rRNA A1518/A1519 N6-dimethyltransferase RsmA/KsgA/DIM1 with predicted DNA glycosylase/AP lyase activity